MLDVLFNLLLVEKLSQDDIQVRARMHRTVTRWFVVRTCIAGACFVDLQVHDATIIFDSGVAISEGQSSCTKWGYSWNSRLCSRRLHRWPESTLRKIKLHPLQ
jgi:hypothetical protein